MLFIYLTLVIVKWKSGCKQAHLYSAVGIIQNNALFVLNGHCFGQTKWRAFVIGPECHCSNKCKKKKKSLEWIVSAVFSWLDSIVFPPVFMPQWSSFESPTLVLWKVWLVSLCRSRSREHLSRHNCTLAWKWQWKNCLLSLSQKKKWHHTRRTYLCERRELKCTLL